MLLGFDESAVLLFQVSGVGSRARLAHSRGSPPATIATMIRGKAEVRGFSLTSVVELSSCFGFTSSPAVFSVPAGTSLISGKTWPQCTHLAAPTSLILPHCGFGQIVRCIEQPHSEQNRVPELF
jgi:hypothetical protein